MTTEHTGDVNSKYDEYCDAIGEFLDVNAFGASYFDRAEADTTQITESKLLIITLTIIFLQHLLHPLCKRP